MAELNQQPLENLIDIPVVFIDDPSLINHIQILDSFLSSEDNQDIESHIFEKIQFPEYYDKVNVDPSKFSLKKYLPTFNKDTNISEITNNEFIKNGGIYFIYPKNHNDSLYNQFLTQKTRNNQLLDHLSLMDNKEQTLSDENVQTKSNPYRESESDKLLEKLLLDSNELVKLEYSSHTNITTANLLRQNILFRSELETQMKKSNELMNYLYEQFSNQLEKSLKNQNEQNQIELNKKLQEQHQEHLRNLTVQQEEIQNVSTQVLLRQQKEFSRQFEEQEAKNKEDNIKQLNMIVDDMNNIKKMVTNICEHLQLSPPTHSPNKNKKDEKSSHQRRPSKSKGFFYPSNSTKDSSTTDSTFDFENEDLLKDSPIKSATLRRSLSNIIMAEQNIVMGKDDSKDTTTDDNTLSLEEDINI